MLSFLAGEPLSAPVCLTAQTEIRGGLACGDWRLVSQDGRF